MCWAAGWRVVRIPDPDCTWSGCCCGGLSTGRGEGVRCRGTGRRLLDVEVDLLELVLESAVPALEPHVDVVLLAQVSREAPMVGVRARDGEARLTRVRGVEGDRQPECRGTGVRSSDGHRRRSRGVCGQAWRGRGGSAAVEQVVGAPTAANNPITSSK